MPFFHLFNEQLAKGYFTTYELIGKLKKLMVLNTMVLQDVTAWRLCN